MSEYQCYEFVALDRLLTTKQMAELRVVSTRAEISPTRFWNEYQWGDLKVEPAKLMERYFDAHLYFANWGTRRLMLRMPKARVELKELESYFVGGHAARFTTKGEHVHLDRGLDVLEIRSGKKLFVSERAGTRQLAQGDVLLGWICVDEEGTVTLEGHLTRGHQW